MVKLLFLPLFFFLHVCSVICRFNTFNLYRTDQSETSLEYDCLDYYVLDDIVEYSKINSWAHQLITCCIRPSTDDEQMPAPHRPEGREYIDAQNLTFDTLKNGNITGEQLLAWSATIELVERYEAFLMGKSELVMSEVYYNCTAGWLGNLCEYTFKSWGEVTFIDIVYCMFKYRTSSEADSTNCYVLLKVTLSLREESAIFLCDASAVVVLLPSVSIGVKFVMEKSTASTRAQMKSIVGNWTHLIRQRSF